MYFLVDIPTCNRLGLQGAEALVFSCLAFLCRDKGYWQGSYSKLANYSLCGDRKTATRACSRLVDAGTICVQDGRFSIGGQNDRLDGQNDRLREKESTKEKENNIKKELVSKNEDQPTNFFEDLSFSPPSKQEAAEYAQSRNIPLEIVGKWWYYWDENNWTRENGRKIRKWQSSLEGFVLREKQAVLQLAGVPQKQVRELESAWISSLATRQRNEEIRKAELQRQHEEREKAEREGVSIPESLAVKFAKFAPKK